MASPSAPPIPRNLPAKYHHLWKYPYGRRARRNKGFKKWLRQNGYLSPNFKINEARCHDSNRTRPTGKILGRAQKHAFNLEQLRWRLGNVPIPVNSWYRTPAHNAAVGGASQSRHMSGDATDHTRQWVDKVGRAKVLREAHIVFKRGGIGIYPGGALHFDSRGYFATWTSW